MALNSITLDGEVIQTVSIAKLRHMPKAYVFMLRYFERTPADSHHAEIYLVYAPAPSPEGESLQHFNPKLGQYIGFIGKIRHVGFALPKLALQPGGTLLLGDVAVHNDAGNVFLSQQRFQAVDAFRGSGKQDELFALLR